MSISELFIEQYRVGLGQISCRDFATINGLYNQIQNASPGDVLSLDASKNLVCSVFSPTGTLQEGSNIAISTVGNATTIAVTNNIDVSGVTINDYIMPVGIGTPNQAICVPFVGNQLTFQTVGGGGGGVSSVTSEDPNITITPTTGDVTVALNPILDLEQLTINGYTMPTSIGTSGQVIGVQALSNQLVFIDNGGGGGAVDSIASANSNINVSNPTGNITLTLEADLTNINTISCSNVTNVGTAQFGVLESNNIHSGYVIENAGVNKIVCGCTDGDVLLNLFSTDGVNNYLTEISSQYVVADNIQGANIAMLTNNNTDILYSLPKTAGTSGKLIAWPASGSQLQWVDETPQGAIDNTDNNLVVTANGNDVTINLATDIILKDATASLRIDNNDSSANYITITPFAFNFQTEDTYLLMNGAQCNFTQPSVANPIEFIFNLGTVGSPNLYAVSCIFQQSGTAKLIIADWSANGPLPITGTKSVLTSQPVSLNNQSLNLNPNYFNQPYILACITSSLKVGNYTGSTYNTQNAFFYGSIYLYKDNSNNLFMDIRINQIGPPTNIFTTVFTDGQYYSFEYDPYYEGTGNIKAIYHMP